MSQRLQAFCIGHVRPTFAPGLPFTMLCPKPLGLAGERVIADDRFGPGVRGAALAEYSQLFGLQDLIEAGDIVADRLYLFQYRKFIGLREGGQPATAPWVRIARPAQAPALMPTLDELQAVPHPVLVGPVFALGASIAQNYALVHVIDDLVAFAACLHAGGLGSAEARRFASFQGLIPSPALCLVDTQLFLRQMRVLRAVWTEFARHADAVREGYQMRVAGYLLERLHSHLLCQWLLDGTQAGVGLGHRFVVLDDKPVAAAVPTNEPEEALA
jgi:hypothetical protein